MVATKTPDVKNITINDIRELDEDEAIDLAKNNGVEDPEELNIRVTAELQKRGIAAPSTTRIAGELAIRCCLMNHRATLQDMDITVDGVLRIVDEMRR